MAPVLPDCRLPPPAECDALKFKAPEPDAPETWDTAYTVSLATNALTTTAELLQEAHPIAAVFAKVGLGVVNGERRACPLAAAPTGPSTRPAAAAAARRGPARDSPNSELVTAAAAAGSPGRLPQQLSRLRRAVARAASCDPLSPGSSAAGGHGASALGCRGLLQPDCCWAWQSCTAVRARGHGQRLSAGPDFHSVFRPVGGRGRLVATH